MNDSIILALFGLWALIPLTAMIKDIGRVEKEIYNIERLLSLHTSYLTFWQKKEKKGEKK